MTFGNSVQPSGCDDGRSSDEVRRFSTGRQWLIVVAASVVGAALQYVVSRLTGQHRLAAFGVIFGGGAAVDVARYAGVSLKYIRRAVVAGVVLGLLLWVTLGTAGQDIWIGIAVALMCPLIGLWVAFYDKERSSPQRGSVLTLLQDSHARLSSGRALEAVLSTGTLSNGAKLIVQRPWRSALWAVRISIMVDGVLVAELRPGQRSVTPLMPGHHQVHARGMRFSSNPQSIEVEPGGSVLLRCAVVLQRPKYHGDTLKCFITLSDVAS